MEITSSAATLFQSLDIGNVTIKNRIAMGPMSLSDTMPPGYASPQTIAMYAARAAGGVGLIITGGTVATRSAWESRPYANVLRFDTDETLANLSEIAEVVHRYETKIFAQLMQGYGRAGSSRYSNITPAAACAEPMILEEGLQLPGFTGRFVGETPRALSIDELQSIENDVGLAAKRAQQAGFDGVELPSMLIYLAGELFSPRYNTRTDDYGGSFENRTRFIRNNVRRVREAVGPGFPIGVRLVADDLLEGGVRLEESVKLAQLLEAEGASYIAIFFGSYERADITVSRWDGEMVKRNIPQAFKAVLRIPVLVPSVHDPEAAAKLIADGVADVTVQTRTLLADPNWPLKVAAGALDTIIKCDRQNHCFVRLFSGLPVRCSQNAELGWERLASLPSRPSAAVSNGAHL